MRTASTVDPLKQLRLPEEPLPEPKSPEAVSVTFIMGEKGY